MSNRTPDLSWVPDAEAHIARWVEVSSDENYTPLTLAHCASRAYVALVLFFALALIA